MAGSEEGCECAEFDDAESGVDGGKVAMERPFMGERPFSNLQKA